MYPYQSLSLSSSKWKDCCNIIAQNGNGIPIILNNSINEVACNLMLAEYYRETISASITIAPFWEAAINDAEFYAGGLYGRRFLFLTKRIDDRYGVLPDINQGIYQYCFIGVLPLDCKKVKGEKYDDEQSKNI
jgi:hypothetical protein